MLLLFLGVKRSKNPLNTLMYIGLLIGYHPSIQGFEPSTDYQYALKVPIKRDFSYFKIFYDTHLEKILNAPFTYSIKKVVENFISTTLLISITKIYALICLIAKSIRLNVSSLPKI